MNTTKLITRALTVSLAIATASAAYAGEGNKQTFRLPQTVQLEGVKLDAGKYQVTWEGAGADVRVSLLKGGQVVVSTQAKMVDLKEKSMDDTALMRPSENATPVLSEIRMRNKAFGLSFAGNTPAVAKSGK